MKLEPGDRIRNRETRIVREIVDVRETGYGWKYPEFGDVAPNGVENYWWSENSSDPFFDWGWEKLTCSSMMKKDM